MKTKDALEIGRALGRINSTIDAWEESKHPRRPDGKFGSGGGSSKSSGEKKSTAPVQFTEKQKKTMNNTLKSLVFKKVSGGNEEVTEIARNEWGYADISNEKMAKMLSSYDPKHEYTIEEEQETGFMGMKFNHIYLVKTPKK
jgi:hypothetical protein